MTILFSFAHPDDESFCGAGLACWCRERGHGVALLCATRGDAGKPGAPEVSGAPADLAAAREQELRNAARILNIDQLHVFDYRDRHLGEAPPDDIRGRLVAVLRRVRPHIVLTFDPNGFNVHPDHVAISRFTADAVSAAADARWLPDAGAPHRVQRLLWTSPLPPWSATRSVGLAAEAGVDFVIDITRWRDRKEQALRAHRTQHQSIERHFLNQPDLDRILSVEVYRQGWGPPLSARPSADVFEGLID